MSARLVLVNGFACAKRKLGVLEKQSAVRFTGTVQIHRDVLSHRVDVAEVALQRIALVQSFAATAAKQPNHGAAASIHDERRVVHDALALSRTKRPAFLRRAIE